MALLGRKVRGRKRRLSTARVGETLELRTLLSADLQARLLAEINDGTQDGFFRTERQSPTLIQLGDRAIGATVTPGQEDLIDVIATDGTAEGTDVLGTFDRISLEVVGETAVFFGLDESGNGNLWGTDGTPAGTQILEPLPGGFQFDVELPFQLGEDQFFIGGEGLWRTDGTSDGTQRLRQFSRVTTVFQPETIVDRAFIVARDSESKQRLWSTDGTAEGTVQLGDFTVENNSFDRLELAELQGQLIFNANDGESGAELWTSDGTPEGTRLLRDIRPGSGASDIRGLMASGDHVYFEANDRVHGFELWATDGTPDGTQLLGDIKPGIQNSQPDFFASVGDTYFFTAEDGVHGRELWASDGTSAGTRMLGDIGPGQRNGQHDNPTILNDILYFQANDQVHGLELWRSDGTDAGTFLVKDIRQGTGSALSGDDFTVAGDEIYFVAEDRTTGTELWKSDGTAAGTVQVADITPGSADSDPDQFTLIGTTLFFVVQSHQLWQVDTATGTPGKLADISSFQNFHVFNEALYFSADANGDGREPWRSDGTVEGTGVLTDIHPTDTSAPSRFTTAGDQLFFVANDGVHGRELWVVDSDADSARLVTDFNQLPQSSLPDRLTVTGNSLFFTATNDITGREPYVLESPDHEARMIRDINPGLPGSDARDFTGLTGGTVLFRADDGELGVQPWTTDGTTAGTALLPNPNSVDFSFPGFASLGSIGLMQLPGRGNELWAFDSSTGETRMLPGQINFFMGVSGGLAYFSGTSEEHGEELWRTDGTAEGTVLVSDVRPGPAGSSPNDFTAVGEQVFFTANNGDQGREIWVSDGSSASLVADVQPGRNGSGPDFLTSHNGMVYFVANGGTVGRELWKTDGTSEGTTLVSDIRTGTDSSNIRHLTSAGDHVFFVANGGVGGRTLWVSDGTEAGTAPLPAPEPFALTEAGGQLFFISNGSLWVSDGTIDGTTRALTPGQELGLPFVSDLVEFNESLVFTAIDQDVGDELWIIDAFDFGDAPGPYPTTLQENGARHRPSELFLGSGVTSQFAAARENDIDDGVAIGPELSVGETTTVIVNASSAGLLDAWIDFNNDGVWSPDEQVADSVALAEGENSVSITVPDNAVRTDSTGARFRLSSQGGLAPTGIAVDGEVEDYELSIAGPGIWIDGETVHVLGGDTADRVVAGNHDDEIWIRFNGEEQRFARSEVSLLKIDVGDGDDRVSSQVDVPAIIVGGPGNDQLIGGPGDDTIKAGSGDDTVRGRNGADAINGGSGHDLLLGGGGNDELAGASGADRLRGGSGADVATGGAGTDRLRGGQGDDQLHGQAGNDQVVGGTGDDILLGGTGDDQVWGRSGRDLIVGGSGLDRLWGGGGQDILVAGIVEQGPGVLSAVLSEWQSNQRYSQRVQNIRDGLSSGSESLTFSTLIRPDAAVDQLFGQAGLDWFYGEMSDAVSNRREREELELF
jgi:ELWxxDGT repeat protein